MTEHLRNYLLVCDLRDANYFVGVNWIWIESYIVLNKDIQALYYSFTLTYTPNWRKCNAKYYQTVPT